MPPSLGPAAVFPAVCVSMPMAPMPMARWPIADPTAAVLFYGSRLKPSSFPGSAQSAAAARPPHAIAPLPVRGPCAIVGILSIPSMETHPVRCDLSSFARLARFLRPVPRGCRVARRRRRDSRPLAVQSLEPRCVLSVSTPDRFEPNDTLQKATDLGTISGKGANEVASLSIHSAKDRDFFKFTTTGMGTSGHYVDVLFKQGKSWGQANGNINARLLDSAGTLLSSSSSVDDNERLMLTNRPAGTYFVEVYGHRQAKNTYKLVFEAPGNANKAPTDIALSSTTISENARANAVVGTLTTTDPDAGNTFTYTLVTGTGSTDNAAFNISGNQLRATASLDFETKSSYSIRLRSTDQSGLFTEKTFTITVTNVDEDAWTIMVYIAADDLFAEARDDINEIERAVSVLPGTVNISVLWDQSSAPGMTTHQTGGGTQPAWGTAGRAFIVPDASADMGRKSVLTSFEILPELNMGDPQTLVDFVNWSVVTAPATRYGLIVWGHGAGLGGFAFDTSDVDQLEDNLTTSELARALTTLRGNGTSIDILAFDACSMAMTEVGYAMRDLVSYFVASQELIPWAGQNYAKMFRTLASNPYAVTTKTFAEDIVKCYAEMRYGWGADTLSAIDASKYASVVSALRSFTTAAGGATAAERKAMDGARLQTVSYPYRQRDSTDGDLGMFMNLIAESSSIGKTIRNAARGVKDAVDQAAVAKASWRGGSGMSIHLPPLGAEIRAEYTRDCADFNAATGWAGFLRGMTGAGRSPQGAGAGSASNFAALAFAVGTGARSGPADVELFRSSLADAAAAPNRIIALRRGRTQGACG